MISLDTNHIRRLHPDWEVVTALRMGLEEQ